MGEKLIGSTQGFRLGLDWSKPSENIDIQALTQAVNAEFDRTDGALRTCSGVKIEYNAEMTVDSLYRDVYRNVWYFSSGNDLYKTDFTTHEKLGSLTGLQKPRYEAFGGDVLVASGGKLQVISGSGSLSTIGGSPYCDIVHAHSGRVLASSINGHRLYWSAIGDYNTWNLGTGATSSDLSNSSNGQWIDVGYKDQGTICAVDFLTKSIIVYKNYGKVYQVVGTPDTGDLAVYPLSTTGYCSGSAINVGDTSYYLGSSGLMSFVPTNTYADIQPFETGLNINSWLLKNIDDTCEMYHISSRKQLWIKPRTGRNIFLYHYMPRYTDGRGVFTSRELAHDVNDVYDHEKNVYICYGTKIGVLDDTIDTDDGNQIKTSLVSGNRLAPRLFILLMNYNFITNNIIEGYGTVQISDKTQKVIEFKSSDTKTYYADGKTYDDNDKLYREGYTKVYKIGGGANRNLQFKILVNKGAISIRQFDYVYEEV